jgi:hypothetical protein
LLRRLLPLLLLILCFRCLQLLLLLIKPAQDFFTLCESRVSFCELLPDFSLLLWGVSTSL